MGYFRFVLLTWSVTQIMENSLKSAQNEAISYFHNLFNEKSLHFRARKVHLDDSGLLSRRQRLHHHVRFDQSQLIFKRCPLERGSGFQGLATGWIQDSLPFIGKQSNLESLRFEGVSHTSLTLLLNSDMH